MEEYYADIESGSCDMSIEALIELSNLYRLFLDYIIYGNQNEKKEEIPGKKRGGNESFKSSKAGGI